MNNLLKRIVILLLLFCPMVSQAKKFKQELIHSCTGELVRIYSSAVTDTLRIFVIADTHLWLSDEREAPFRQYSKRMAAAYNETTHFKTGEKTNPEKAFRQTVALAKTNNADVIALLGDIVSYPSERAVEFVQEVMRESGIPYYYTCGNHDWHYEGMEGTSQELRKKWRQERLMPLFRGNDPVAYGVEHKGVRLLFFDTSNNEIEERQLQFIREEARRDEPFILFQHIPLYAPSRSVGYGIGHPQWGAATDGGYKIERRNQWPEGHKKVDYDFYDTLVEAPNLLATFAGHVHLFGTDIIKGRPHFTVGPNCTGAYYEVAVMPLKKP
ncbi:MAG: metallophosphoesterase [Bacteroidaceae bacterium]|nr:metallophosphoesterase [Bacteroidaceae bacterium]